MMKDAPKTVGGRRVLEFSVVDARQRYTADNERRSVGPGNDERLVGSVAGLVVCQNPDGSVALLGCDRKWRQVWSVDCRSESEAREQAEFEYAGVGKTWKSKKS